MPIVNLLGRLTLGGVVVFASMYFLWPPTATTADSLDRTAISGTAQSSVNNVVDPTTKQAGGLVPVSTSARATN